MFCIIIERPGGPDRLVLWSLDHEVLDSTPTRGRIQLMTVPTLQLSQYDLNNVERNVPASVTQLVAHLTESQEIAALTPTWLATSFCGD